MCYHVSCLSTTDLPNVFVADCVTTAVKAEVKTKVCMMSELDFETFEPLRREAESASLDDEEYDYTGKKLQAYILHGVRYAVNNWKEMLIQVCGHILREKRSTIEWLCANEKYSLSTTPEEGKYELAPGIYVFTHNNTITKIYILRGMFKECNIFESELIFEFRYDQDEESEE